MTAGRRFALAASRLHRLAATAVRAVGRTAVTALVVSMLTAVASPQASPAAAAGTTPTAGLWGSGEVRFADLRPFQKWTSALARYDAERQSADARTCQRGSGLGCAYRQWQAALDGAAAAGRLDQLAAVNRFINARAYVTDADNWQQSDHWATPGEFFTRAGDCEDYAIAKYLSLRRLGWSDDEVRILAVRDERRQIGHAVVVARIGGEIYVLDNQIARPTRLEALGHYRPVFSLNTSGWWLHRPAPDA